MPLRLQIRTGVVRQARQVLPGMCTVAALTTRFLVTLTVPSQRPQWPSTDGAGAAIARAFGILAPPRTPTGVARQARQVLPGMHKGAAQTKRSWPTLTATLATEAPDESGSVGTALCAGAHPSRD